MFSRKKRVLIEIILVFCFVFAIIIGVAIGLAIATTKNIQATEKIGEYQPALPSQVLDRNGELITEIFADEKREIISIDELPKHLIYALITREDQKFFEHHGFSVRGTLRAAWNVLMGNYFSGGSTITQQVAGQLYADRTKITLRRKLRELWYALQLERSLTKNQILELYLNREYFGHNTYGVEAASQFYFGHSARDVTLAEAVMLVIQLANPARYSPIKYPERVKKLQYEVLQQMVNLGYVTKEEANLSFQKFWNEYDPTRSNIASAYFENESKAPYFSEFVRQQLEEMLYGSLDINRDGFIIHTTLDLDYQRAAREIMDKGLKKVNETYQANTQQRLSFVDKQFVPLVDILALSFDIPEIRAVNAQQLKKGRDDFEKNIAPVLDVLALMFDSEEINFIANMAHAQKAQEAKKTTVEGALITIDNNTGHILAMIGGSDFTVTKLNRATQAKVMPGSSFKPLYYSAAISSKKLTEATLIYDAPVVFWNEDGTPYTPSNYMGRWEGPVLAWYALAHSMNVPSLKVLDMIGFDTAINRASRLLGITDPEQIRKTFPRKYPLGLGIIGIAPIQMARAFATFANEGKEVEPLAITYVEDRRGNIILEPEKELRASQKREGENIQILSPQSAYIMVDMLKRVVKSGTLAWSRTTANDFDGMPMAGKTGTTQNWSDAWTVGFSPYMTTAIWFGFDLPGNSLGINQTGATAAGPLWAEYMKKIHEDLPIKNFQKPDSGLTEVKVCRKSGLLPTEECSEGTVDLFFLSGTEPRRFCDLHSFEKKRDEQLMERLKRAILTEDINIDYRLPEIEENILEEYRLDSELEESLKSSMDGNPLLD